MLELQLQAEPSAIAAPRRLPSDCVHPGTAELRNIRAMHVLERVSGRFAGAGIPLMALKGAALQLTLSKRPAERPMGDLDLLVRPADLERALALIEELGGLRAATFFREDFFPRYYHQVEYRIGVIAPVEIDLHVRPFRMLRSARLVPADALWGRARRVALGGATILVPGREDMLVHLAAHSAVHGNSREIWLRDIHEWARRHRDSLDWRAFLDAVAAWRLAPPVYSGLDAAERAFGRIVPGNVSAALRALPESWRDRLALWHAPRDGDHQARSVLVNLLTTPGLRFRAGYLRDVLLPDRGYLDAWCARHDHRCAPWAHAARWIAPLLRHLPRLSLRRAPLRVAPSAAHGYGVFATRDIPAGQVIARYRGRPVDRAGTYVSGHVDAEGRQARHEITGPLRFLNHNCRPNARLDHFRLAALRPIRRGEEITMDYGPGACTCERTEA